MYGTADDIAVFPDDAVLTVVSFSNLDDASKILAHHCTTHIGIECAPVVRMTRSVVQVV